MVAASPSPTSDLKAHSRQATVASEPLLAPNEGCSDLSDIMTADQAQQSGQIADCRMIGKFSLPFHGSSSLSRFNREGYRVDVVPIAIPHGPPLHRRLRDIAAYGRRLPNNTLGVSMKRPAYSVIKEGSHMADQQYS